MSLLKFSSGVRMTSPLDLGVATYAPFWGNCRGNFTEEIWIQHISMMQLFTPSSSYHFLSSSLSFSPVVTSGCCSWGSCDEITVLPLQFCEIHQLWYGRNLIQIYLRIFNLHNSVVNGNAFNDWKLIKGPIYQSGKRGRRSWLFVSTARVILLLYLTLEILESSTGRKVNSGGLKMPPCNTAEQQHASPR